MSDAFRAFLMAPVKHIVSLGTSSPAATAGSSDAGEAETSVTATMRKFLTIAYDNGETAKKNWALRTTILFSFGSALALWAVIFYVLFR